MGSILWVIKKGPILWVIFSKPKKGPILWVIFFKKNLCVIIFEKKKFKSASHQKKKGPILWINFQKHKFQVSASGTILWVMRKINSLRIFSKKKQFFKSNENMSHMQKRRCSIRWVVLKKGFDSLSNVQKSSLLWVMCKKRLTSLSQIHKKKKSSILWVKFIKEGSLLWVILKRRCKNLNHFFLKGSILSSHGKKKGWILRVIFKKKSNSLSHIGKGFNSLRQIQRKRVQFSASFLKKVQFLETWKKTKKISILYVIFKKKGPILSVLVKKKFNSWGQTE